jgi:cell fate regulator YaaT (PSP1 superfamily)
VVAVDFIDSGIDFDQLVVIYFTAPHRVDFRTLVSDLARTLHARIDLRQIGSRDAARLVGGLGNCGRDLCCATFLKDFEPVSLRMARVQDLPPNPLKISGACGRLMCCLKYEHPLYAEFARTAPAVGEQVALEDGDGVVVGHQVPADSVVIRMSANGATRTCSLAAACGARQLFASRTAPAEVPRPPRKGRMRRRRSEEEER